MFTEMLIPVRHCAAPIALYDIDHTKGTRARTHEVIKGTFEVFDDLPAHLKQGEIFSKGGSHGRKYTS